MTEGVIPFPQRQPDDQPEPAAELTGPVLSGEVLDPDGLVPIPVDPPHAPPAGPVWERRVERAPVVPAWVREPDTRRAAAKWALDLSLHRLRWHAVHFPVLLLRLTAASPRGLGRTVAAAARWTADAETAEQRRSIGNADPKALVRLAEIHQARTRSRAARIALAAAGFIATWFVLGAAGPHWSQTMMLAAVVGILGFVGRRKDKPLIGKAVSTEQAPRLTSDMVEGALRSVGIKGDIEFRAPIARDKRGWLAVLDLPGGTTAAEVIEKREELSSAIRRPVGAVWPEPDPEEHAGRLRLWVGDESMSKAKQAPWPLARTGTVDLFGPFPFATDKRGRPLALTLFESNVLIGALAGAGKTAAVRLIALAAGLDPLAETWLFELYGKGDLASAERFATRYGSGMDDETIEQALWALRDALDDIQRRAEVMKGLPRDLCPDGKTTRRVAEQARFGLHPLVIVLDECQNLFQHEEYGKEAGALAAKIIRMGRAVGVILVLSTQRPNRDAIPTAVSALAGIRFCLRVMEQLSNDMILGTSMYKAGVRATMLRPSDRGVGWLVGAGDDPVIGRTYYQDLRAADRIADRARALRVDAGTLAGHAAGEPLPERGPRLSILRDLIAVFGPLEEKAHSDDLCSRLADLWPDRYEGWESTTLAAALRPLNVRTQQVWAAKLEDGEPGNKRGVVRQDVTDALAARDQS